MSRDPIKNLPVIPFGFVTHNMAAASYSPKNIAISAWVNWYHKPYAMDISEATAMAYDRKNESQKKQTLLQKEKDLLGLASLNDSTESYRIQILSAFPLYL